MPKSPREIAIDALSRRDLSVREMQIKLKRKGVSRDDTEEIVKWLVEKKLLNDNAFAQRKAESIFRTKICGMKYIENKLREAGIASDVIHEVVEELAPQEVWEDRAKKAVEQWKKIHPKHAEDKVRKMRFLASRGF